MKIIQTGIKNELTNYRIMELSSINLFRLLTLNHIFFQDHLFISLIETSLILLLSYRNAILFNTSYQIHKLLNILSLDYLYLYYIIFISKTFYSFTLYSLLITFFYFIEL